MENNKMVERKKKYATIKVDLGTREAIHKLKIVRRETLDEVICRLVEFYLETKANEKPKEE